MWNRAALPADLKLYVGGEDNFCHRLNGPADKLGDFGALDRRELAARKVTPMLADTPMMAANHAFTTGSRITFSA